MADAHAKPRHDYHLVDPSPWPAIGSISAFIMAVGAICWMHQMFAAAPLVFAAGTLGVLYTMLSWWRDIINEAEHEGYHTRVVQISHRYGMILFIASEVMFFVAWFWTCSAMSGRRRRAPIMWRSAARSTRGTCRCSTR
jgi:cytochrome c oxidase subunit 3